jgi:hypothetical protein
MRIDTTMEKQPLVAQTMDSAQWWMTSASLTVSGSVIANTAISTGTKHWNSGIN